MSFIGKLLYKIYYGPKNKKITIENYGGIERYSQMRDGEREMRHYALNKLEINKPISAKGKFKLNFLTGDKFIHQSLFCVYSFFKYLSDEEASNFSVTFYDDNTLKRQTIDFLSSKFPKIKVVSYNTAMDKVKLKFPLKKYPFINKKVKELFFFNKIFFLHAETDGLQIYLDSDMLFVKKPQEFLNWLEKNYESSSSAFAIHDIMQSYGYEASILNKVAGYPVKHQVNAGFYGLQGKAIDFNNIEHLIRELEENYGSSYYMEQFITSLILTGQENLSILSKDDFKVWPTAVEIAKQEGVLHHYVSISKYGYFTESWKKQIEYEYA